MDSEDLAISVGLKKIIESLKRGEKSTTIVKQSWIQENDKEWADKMGITEDGGNVTIAAELVKLVKVEDWLKDGSSFKRLLLKGRSGRP